MRGRQQQLHHHEQLFKQRVHVGRDELHGGRDVKQLIRQERIVLDAEHEAAVCCGRVRIPRLVEPGEAVRVVA